MNNNGQSQNGVYKNGVPLVPPSDELIEELGKTTMPHNGRAYRKLMKQIDWRLGTAEQIDAGLGVSLAFVDLERAKQLAKLGLELYPTYEPFVRVQPLFDPPSSRAIKRKWPRSTPGALETSAAWIREHNDDYELGHWLAVKNGELLADAPTLKELDEKIESLGTPSIASYNTIIHKVIS